MVLQVVFACMLGAAVIFGMATGRGDQVFQGVLDGAGDGMEMALTLCASFGVFGGLMQILSYCGAENKLKKWLKKPLCMLLGDVPEEALGYVAMNISANMLGLGNAATPAGVKAAKLLARGQRATRALCMFLVINTSSVQLMPAMVIAMRAARGARDPGAVLLPGLMATALSTAVGILACKWMEKRQ